MFCSCAADSVHTWGLSSFKSISSLPGCSMRRKIYWRNVWLKGFICSFFFCFQKTRWSSATCLEKKKKKKNQNRDIKTSMTHSTELWGIYIYQLPHFSNRVKQIWLYKHFLQDPNTLSYGNTGTEILSHWAWSSLAVQHFPCPIKEEMNQPLHWLHWKITLNSFCMSFLGHRPPTPPSSHCPFGT